MRRSGGSKAAAFPNVAFGEDFSAAICTARCFSAPDTQSATNPEFQATYTRRPGASVPTEEYGGREHVREGMASDPYLAGACRDGASPDNAAMDVD